MTIYDKTDKFYEISQYNKTEGISLTRNNDSRIMLRIEYEYFSNQCAHFLSCACRYR